MSFGKMNTKISIVKEIKSKDDEGFAITSENVIATVWAYQEGRHGSKRWANMAQFSEATDLFRFRVIPGVTVTKDMLVKCNNRTFEIISIEDVKGRKMYLEILAREVLASG